MFNKKLLMFAVAGLLTPAAYEGVANAEVHGSQITIAVPAPKNDTAPTNTVNTPAGAVKRLRRTDQEQPGNEMTAFSLFANGKDGLFFSMSTELNGVRAANAIQMSLTKFSLVQDSASGAVSALADTATAKFVTKNNGNERRNANAPTAQTINGGNVICAKYNYQPNGTNDTVRYVQCFNAAGATVLPQTKAFAKNNDDCSMHQDGEPGVVTSYNKTTGVTKMIDWAGCNGNGADDGWAFVTQIQCNADPQAAGDCKFQNLFDVSLAQREERSRGSCTVDAADTSYAVCSWTEGNNQPQRDGVWLAAVDLSTNAKGANQQQTILWKKQVAGRIDNNAAAGGKRTYAQRAVQERIMVPDTAGTALVPSDTIIYRWGDATGNNNTNQGKGGTYRTQMMAVIKTSRTGMTYVAPAVDMASQLLGLGGTHLGATAAMFGTTDKMTPGLVFLNGSHTGGGPGAQIRAVGFDTATNKFSDLGMGVVGSQDRHLYSNYLGNNPGNQGRNHSQLTMVKNPFVGQAGNTDAYLLLTATSGKEMANACTGCIDTVSNAAIKLTAFMAVTGLAQTPAVAAGTAVDPTKIPSAPGQTGGDSGVPADSSDPGTTLGGCNAGGSSGGLATFFLIGLAAFIRRRR
jgi:uncharacterized protein (TIGR03382 family)